MREKLTGSVVKDFATYIFFLLIVAKLAYSEKDFHQYIYREDMVNMFNHAKYGNGPKFEQVQFFSSLL